jgi:hypothetical protein
MAAHKKPREYFLTRIKEFHSKHNRVPRANDFNGPFCVNVNRLFGSWRAALKLALNVSSVYGPHERQELIDQIVAFSNSNGRIPALEELKAKGYFKQYFTSYSDAIESALGVNPKREIYLSLALLCGNGADCATLSEIHFELKRKRVNIKIEQLRGMVQQIVRENHIAVSTGDRLKLYALTNAGNLFLKSFTRKNV